MVNNHISNLISRLNNGENRFEIDINKTIINILDNLELKGFINYFYNPYNKKIFIFNNKIKYITVKSKPSRKVFVKEIPYKLNLGTFITKNLTSILIKQINSNKQLLELILYVE